MGIISAFMTKPDLHKNKYAFTEKNDTSFI